MGGLGARIIMTIKTTICISKRSIGYKAKRRESDQLQLSSYLHSRGSSTFQSKGSINHLGDHGKSLKPLSFEKYGGNKKKERGKITVFYVSNWAGLKSHGMILGCSFFKK